MAAPQQLVVDLRLISNTGTSVVVEPVIRCEPVTLEALDSTQLALMVLIVDEGSGPWAATCEVSVSHGPNKGTCVQHVNIAADWRRFNLRNFAGTCLGGEVDLNVPTGGIWSERMAVVAFV